MPRPASLRPRPLALGLASRVKKVGAKGQEMLDCGGGNNDEFKVEAWEHGCEGGEVDSMEREDSEGGFPSIG